MEMYEVGFQDFRLFTEFLQPTQEILKCNSPSASKILKDEFI